MNTIELTLAQNRASSKEATQEDLNGLYADVSFMVDNEWMDGDPLEVIFNFKPFASLSYQEWIYVKNIRINKRASAQIQWKKRAFIGIEKPISKKNLKKFNFDY